VREELHLLTSHRAAGVLELERARVRWFLSIDQRDLPFPAQPGQKATHRSITVDGQEVEFSEGFGDLHTAIYRETLAGRGFGIEHARASIELVHRLRTAPLQAPGAGAHPLARRLA
jgi:UDP-N-acetyl-2-amino-2-deoxyglucuronate dehydrogenase